MLLATYRGALGAVVPMPTLPSDFTYTLSVPPDTKLMLLDPSPCNPVSVSGVKKNPGSAAALAPIFIAGLLTPLAPVRNELESKNANSTEFPVKAIFPSPLLKIPVFKSPLKL